MTLYSVVHYNCEFSLLRPRRRRRRRFYATIRVHCSRKVCLFFVLVWRVRFLLCNFQNEQKRRHRRKKNDSAKSLKREACACNKQRRARREDT